MHGLERIQRDPRGRSIALSPSICTFAGNLVWEPPVPLYRGCQYTSVAERRASSERGKSVGFLRAVSDASGDPL